MTSFTTSIDIAAPIERVWQVLTEEMPRDPTPFGILRLEGDVARNGRITLWSDADPKRAFALKVVAFEPPSGMVWRGGMPLGLFTGARTFSLTRSEGATSFTMKENYSGPLSGLIVRSIPDLTPSFETFSHALKERAERNE